MIPADDFMKRLKVVCRNCSFSAQPEEALIAVQNASKVELKEPLKQVQSMTRSLVGDDADDAFWIGVVTGYYGSVAGMHVKDNEGHTVSFYWESA